MIYAPRPFEILCLDLILRFVLSVLVLLKSDLARGQGEQPNHPATSEAKQNEPAILNPPWAYLITGPVVFSDGYLLGRVVNGAARGFPVRTFQAEIYLGESSSPGGVINEKCLQSELERLRQIDSQIETSRERVEEEKKDSTSSSAVGSTAENSPDIEGVVLSQAENACLQRVNPWTVSSYDLGWLDQAEKYATEMLLIRYKAFIITPLLASHYVIEDVLPVDQGLLQDGASVDVSGHLGLYDYSISRWGSGYYDGRVVQASVEGVVRNAYEVIFQVGRSGRKFVKLGVPDRTLFEFIVKAMATGKMMRLSYYQLFGPVAAPSQLLYGYDNLFRVYRAEVLHTESGQ